MVVLTSDYGPAHARGWRGARRLTCAILGHYPAPGAAWNHGYGFGHCGRCGVPIMRAVFGGWRTPPAGYRIVWPGQRDGRPRAAGGPRAIGDGDFMIDGAPVPAPQPRRGRTAVPGDFMADDADTPTEPPRRHHAR